MTACPAARVAAPCDVVWALLNDPASYAEWWGAQTDRIVPTGPAAAGQMIEGHAAALGRQWRVRVTVTSVDADRQRIGVRTALPLGITAINQITCAPLASGHCRLQFG
ncbi:MAG: hypothetical protein NVSMB65_06360 [Chloroflexota bacterium]